MDGESPIYVLSLQGPHWIGEYWGRARQYLLIFPAPVSRADDPTVLVSGSGRLKREGVVRWQKGRMIGRGGFAAVYIGQDMDNRRLMAVKEIQVSLKRFGWVDGRWWGVLFLRA